MIGSFQANYAEIREPSRTQTTHGLVLEKASISASQYMGASVSLIRGRHAQPIWYASATSYEAVLEFASNMPVILFDTRARRGFLIDGCSALLHLCCSRLWSKNARRFFDKEALENTANFRYDRPRSGDAGVERAFRILIDDRNRALVLRKIRTEEVEEVEVSNHEWQPQRRAKIAYWRFEDLVVETWQYLHKIYDYQSSPPSGIDIRMTDRDRLEGWSFKSIVDRVPLLQPKMVYLDSSGRGWADFVRRAGAITLMADGFDEILYDAASVCQAWTSVPKQLDYLAASISTLRDIYERNPAELEFPSSLGFETYWHKPHLLFENCTAEPPCISDGQCCDRLQVLLPSTWMGGRTVPAANSLSENGAVIFGHCPRHQFEWPISGAPKNIFSKCKTLFRRVTVEGGAGLKRARIEDSMDDAGSDTPAGIIEQLSQLPHLSLTSTENELERLDGMDVDEGHSEGDTFNSRTSSAIPSTRSQQHQAMSDSVGHDSLADTTATSLSNHGSTSGQDQALSDPPELDKGVASQHWTGEPGQSCYNAPVAVAGSRTLKRKQRFLKTNDM